MGIPISNPDVVKAANIIAASNDRLTQTLERFITLMSQVIQEFKTTVDAAFDKIATATDGLSADVAALKDEIAKLSTDAISDDDKAALESIKSRVNGLADKLSALDALTVPPTPSE